MKIEKKKVLKRLQKNRISQTAIIAALGLSSIFTLNACEDPSSALRNDDDPDINSSNDTAVSSSNEDPASSSSSKIIDIPKSYEHYSSSSIEALSSAARLSAMRPTSSSITAGIPHVYSSPIVPPSSSSITTPPLAGDIIPIEHSSSSSATQPSSSSANDETIKKNPEIDSTLVPTIVPDFPAIKDSLIRIHLCEDPNSPGCLIESMVTTLETDDIA
jgi:hypothetical protein